MRKTWVMMLGVALGLSLSVRAEDRTTRSDKSPGVSIRAATMTATAGYDKAAFAGQTLYISPQSLLTADQVTGVTTREVEGGVAMSLTLTAQAAGRLSGSAVASHAAVFADGQLVAAGALSVSGGQATISGLSSGQAERVSRMLSKGASPSGAAITVVPVSQSNGQYVFDAFAQNAAGVRTYQVKLAATGGDRGSLSLSEVRIDEARADYVFHGNEAVKAADQSGSRLGGTLFNGTVDVASPMYLGTWVFQASPDAAGSFHIKVMAEGDTFLANTRNETIASSATGATVQIGGSVPARLHR